MFSGSSSPPWHHGYNQQPLAPFNRNSARQFLACTMPVHVDLPVAKTVHERTFRYRSFLQALLDLPARDPSLFHSLLTMVQDHDPNALPGQLLDHKRRSGTREVGRGDWNDLGYTLSN
jgi:hypothetical protein